MVLSALSSGTSMKPELDLGRTFTGPQRGFTNAIIGHNSDNGSMLFNQIQDCYNS